MLIVRDLADLGRDLRGRLVLALGNFDGVHCGHQALLKKTLQLAAQVDALPGVMTFDPHPLQLLAPQKIPPMIINQKDKVELLGNNGMEVVLVVPFTREFAELSPRAFFTEVLLEQVSVKGLVVGYNYTFGQGGKGTAETLLELGYHYSVPVEIVPPVTIRGQRVSSTLVRHYIQIGNMKAAATCLGYYPYLSGQVTRGDARGRELGFPTANLAVDKNLAIPAQGVYAVRLIWQNQIWPGVANLGKRPTFYDNGQLGLEVFILDDFSSDLYGETVKVEFLHKLRDEKKFNSVDELQKQISLDVEQARGLFYTPCI